VPDALGWLTALVLGLDTLRRVYAVGRTLNDHFVAGVVVACMGFYALMHQVGPDGTHPWMLLGQLGIWALFFGIHRDHPHPLSPLLGWGSQLAYAWALWGGLTWWIHAPLALIAGTDPWWPGRWLVPALVLAGWGTLQAATRGLVVRRHRIPKLPGRVVQLSDLHASAFMHKAQLDRLVDRVNSLHPDWVVVTGDLVMPFSEGEHGYLVDALARLEAPVLCCPGNHDLPVLQELVEGLAAVGIPLLVDQQVLSRTDAGVLQVTGVNFHWSDARAQLTRALEALPAAPADTCRLLLAHDPRLGAWIPPDRFDLVLSGHTHGGQVAGNMFGLPASVLRPLGVRDQGWWWTGRTRHYVHRGNWCVGLPPRMGVAGEIAVFEPTWGPAG